ncbi:MAG: GDSL family lipase [Calditrichaeota bacterium]|nr:MAG: GDSL family lipase [Calditrichota bacterium]
MTKHIQNCETILFMGDSITDCGRRTDPMGLGNGFVRLFHDLVLAQKSEIDIKIINRGISGETVVDLRKRWPMDVIEHQPDWLCLLIGINDIHTCLNKEKRAVSPEAYAQTYREIMEKTRQELPSCQIVLVDPFYICQPAGADSFQKSVLRILPAYHRTISEMQTAFQTARLQLHNRFAELLQNQEAEKYCPEPVHPNATGHMVIALEIYKVLCGGKD